MKNIITRQFWLIWIILIGCNAIAQKHRPIGFVPLEAKMPNKNPFFEPKTEQEKKEQEELEIVFSNLEPYSWQNRDNGKLNKQLQDILKHNSNISEYSNFGKSQYYFRRAELFGDLKHIFDNAIYNSLAFTRNKPLYDSLHNVNPNYQISQKVEFDFLLKGTQKVIEDYKKAKELSETKKHHRYIDFHIVDYARKSRFLSRTSRRFDLDTLYNTTKLEYFHDMPQFLNSLNNDSLTTKVKEILVEIHEAYQRTKYNGEDHYIAITPSANYKFDRAGTWIGGEVAIDFVNDRPRYNVKKLFNTEHWSRRISAFHFGFNMVNTPRRLNEYYFGTFRRSEIYGVYFKIFQFGFIQNVDESQRNAWFYRPQIGLSIGHFQLFYSYTAVFIKELRQLAPKHAVNIRFSMPYFRVSRYDRQWL